MLRFVKKPIRLLLFKLSDHSVLVRRMLDKEIRRRETKAYDAISRQSTLEERTIIFSSFMGRSYSDSPRSIYLKLTNDKKYDNWRFVWTFKPFKYHKIRLEKDIINALKRITPNVKVFYNYSLEIERMEIVKYKSPEYYDIMASAKYWISNSRLPDEVVPRKDQTYLQTWHGTPIKRLGSDLTVKQAHPIKSNSELSIYYELEAVKWTYVLAQNEYGAKIMNTAFQLDSLGKSNAIKTIGYPRNDYLSRYNKSDVEKIRSKLFIPNNKKIALYAPTYRDHQHSKESGYIYDIGVNLDKLRTELEDEWVILFRTHYFVSNQLNLANYRGFIYDVSDYEEVNDLYIASDLLISDYSSMVFDYSVLNKPILFHMYDLEEYSSQVRGFYMELDDLPGDITHNEDELIEILADFNNYKKRTKSNLQLFRNKYNRYDDGNSTARAIELIMNDKEKVSNEN